MARLKDRQRQIPAGFRFSLPEIGYESSPFSSFDSIVNSVVKLTNANTELAVKHGWPIDRMKVADWVDSYNAAYCEAMGYKEFYVEGGDDAHSSAVKSESWPIWAKTIATLKTDADGGVGDTVERVIGTDNSKAIKDWYLKTFKRICGCDGRKAEWNIKYPYSK